MLRTMAESFLGVDCYVDFIRLLRIVFEDCALDFRVPPDFRVPNHLYYSALTVPTYSY